VSLDYVSRHHAAIYPSHEGYIIRDFSSTNGLFINKRKVAEQLLFDGDTISLGSPHVVHFRYSNSDSPPAERLFHFTKQTLFAGRAYDNDFVIANNTVSAQHIKVSRKPDGSFEIIDLGSANGTWYQGERVYQIQIYPGESINIGSVELLFGENYIVYHEKQIYDQLEVIDLGISIKGKEIIKDISLVLGQGEFIGIIGPSGSGKTTLLKALSAYLYPAYGDVRIFGSSIFNNLQEYKKIIGYVPQDDHVYSDLSVSSCLRYAALLRLSKNNGESMIDSTVETILDIMGLSEVKDRMIFCLSGGQRKRVNVAVEMLTRPTILFLDEPSAGLDPCNEARLMKYLKTMALNSQIVITTTHILYNLSSFDKIAVIAQGELIYFGPPEKVVEFFFEDQDKASEKTVLDIFDILDPEVSSDLEQKKNIAAIFKKKYCKSPYFRELMHKLSGIPGQITTPRSLPFVDNLKEICFPSLHELSTLIHRHLRRKWNNPRTLSLLMIQPVVLAGVIMLSQKLPNVRIHGEFYVPISLPLLIVLSSIWCGTINSCREISGETHIFLHEKMANMGIFDYIASKLPFLLIICLFQSIILTFPVFLLVDLKVNLYKVLAITFMAASTSTFLGLFISSCDQGGDKSVLAVPIVLLPQIIFSGALSPNFLAKMSETSRLLSDVMISRWVFEAMWNECNAPRIIGWGSLLVTKLGFQTNIFGRNMIILLLYSLLFFVFTWLVLAIRRPH